MLLDLDSISFKNPVTACFIFDQLYWSGQNKYTFNLYICTTYSCNMIIGRFFFFWNIGLSWCVRASLHKRFSSCGFAVNCAIKTSLCFCCTNMLLCKGNGYLVAAFIHTPNKDSQKADIKLTLQPCIHFRHVLLHCQAHTNLYRNNVKYTVHILFSEEKPVSQLYPLQALN